MNGDRGEGFEGDFAACRRIKGLLADCNVRFPDCLVLTSPRVSSEDEAVVTPRTKKSSARLEPTSGRASSPPVEQIPLEAFASLRLMWYGIPNQPCEPERLLNRRTVADRAASAAVERLVSSLRTSRCG